MNNGITFLFTCHVIFTIAFFLFRIILKKMRKQKLGISILFGVYLCNLTWIIYAVLFVKEWLAIALFTFDSGLVLSTIGLITFFIQVFTKEQSHNKSFMQ